MPVTPEDIAVVRSLPGLPRALDFFQGWKVVSVRTVNKTGSSIQVKLGNGKLRKEFRLTVSYLLRAEGFLGPKHEFESAFWDAFRPKAGAADVCTEYQRHGIKEPPFRTNGGEAVLEVLFQELPNIRAAYDAALELARGGEPLRKQRAHNRERYMKDAKLALELAFANGSTREEVHEMIDLLLVKEIMER